MEKAEIHPTSNRPLGCLLCHLFDEAFFTEVQTGDKEAGGLTIVFGRFTNVLHTERVGAK